jgi:hypothetical protein
VRTAKTPIFLQAAPKASRRRLLKIEWPADPQWLANELAASTQV